MDTQADGQGSDWRDVSRQAWVQHAGVRNDECCRAICVLGAGYVGSAFSFYAAGGRRTRIEYRPDFGVDGCDAGRNVRGLCELWVYCGLLQPQMDLYRISADRHGAGADVCI